MYQTGEPVLNGAKNKQKTQLAQKGKGLANINSFSTRGESVYLGGTFSLIGLFALD